MLSAALTMLSINLSNMKNGQTNQQATINNQTKSSRVQVGDFPHDYRRFGCRCLRRISGVALNFGAGINLDVIGIKPSLRLQVLEMLFLERFKK
jgi:hypothetical protein